MGPDKTKCLDTRKYDLSVWSKIKSHLALFNRAKPLACTLKSVGVLVCHARPRDPGRARAGPGPGLFPTLYLSISATYAAQNGPNIALSAP